MDDPYAFELDPQLQADTVLCFRLASLSGSVDE
jgi:hypothetical protein